MKWYYATGNNGSILQCEDGRQADTVGGNGDDFESLSAEAEADTEVRWQSEPLFGDFDAAEMAEYVGAE